MNVAHLLVNQARQRPDAAAIVEPAGSISFAQLDDRSARCAQFLLDCGLNPGDHILLFVPMSIELYLALIAILRVGAVATSLDPSATPSVTYFLGNDVFGQANGSTIIHLLKDGHGNTRVVTGNVLAPTTTESAD